MSEERWVTLHGPGTSGALREEAKQGAEFDGLSGFEQGFGGMIGAEVGDLFAGIDEGSGVEAL